MRKILTITLALTLCASAAMADHIGLYTDAIGSDCTLNAPASPGPNTFYAVQKFNVGATAVKFRIQDTLGWFAASQSVTPGYLSIGNWFTGIEIAFPSCVIGDHVLGTVSYFYFGTPTTCANSLDVVFDPTSPVVGEIVVVDCTQPFGQIETATGGRAFGGPNADTCGGCGEVATSETTWGSIKALYR